MVKVKEAVRRADGKKVSEKKVTSGDRKRMEKFRKKLLKKSATLREKRKPSVTPELFKASEAVDKAFEKLPLSSRKKYREAATDVTEHMEMLYPMREKPIWVKAHAWWRYRKIRKQMLHHAKVSRCMREDVLDPGVLDECITAEKAFKKAKVLDFLDFSRAGDRLTEVVEEVNPIEERSKWGENLEIAVVAIAVALGARTYFVQPFKIPTGSMQPTLYGQTFNIGQTTTPIVDKNWVPQQVSQSLPGRLGGFTPFLNPLFPIQGFITGIWYREYRASIEGRFTVMGTPDKMGQVPCAIDGPSGKSSLFYIHRNVLDQMRQEGLFKDYYQKGDIVAAYRKNSGDHILVNKVAYNYARPKRGDIIVFSTRNVSNPRSEELEPFPGVSPLDFYIKRLVGMPGENISIQQDRRLYADGKVVLEPAVFERQYLRRYDGKTRLKRKHLDTTPNGSIGYTPQGQAASPEGMPLGDNRYLPMGDNTNNSLDGRYFGGIIETDLVGRGWGIYWPFSRLGKMDRDIKQWKPRLGGASPSNAGAQGVPPGLAPAVPPALAP